MDPDRAKVRSAGPSSEGASWFVPGRGQACLGPELQFSGAAAHSGSSAGRTRATGASPPGRRPRRSPPAPRPLRGVARWAPSERTHTTRASPGEIATHPFFSRHFSPTSFCFVLSRFRGQSGVQKSKHKTKPEVGSRGPRRRQVLRAHPRPGILPAAGPRGPAGRSAVVLARVEARGRTLQAAVAERRVLLGLEPQAG